MARLIKRKKQRKMNIKKYGDHKLDKFFYISRGKRKYKNHITYTAYFQLTDELVLKRLRMSKKCLEYFKLKKFNYRYVANKCKKVLENMIVGKLEAIRIDIDKMLRNKGNDEDIGYTDLRLGNRIISARSCYEATDCKPAYFYGDIDSNASEQDNDFFLMRSDDDEKSWSEIER
eukprot:UN08708